mgnify:CR=1 FL=1
MRPVSSLTGFNEAVPPEFRIEANRAVRSFGLSCLMAGGADAKEGGGGGATAATAAVETVLVALYVAFGRTLGGTKLDDFLGGTGGIDLVCFVGDLAAETGGGIGAAFFFRGGILGGCKPCFWAESTKPAINSAVPRLSNWAEVIPALENTCCHSDGMFSI